MQSHKFIEASKKINAPNKLQKFIASGTYQMIVSFISELQQSVCGKASSSVKKPTNPCVCGLEKMMDKLDEIFNETPVQKTEQRFGNTALKIFYEKVGKDYESILLEAIKPKEDKLLALELKNYLMNSFGSNMRLDYGTGHELNFLCILLILYLTGYYSREDFDSLVVHVFYRYILFVRKLQVTYVLEPAGAHGVWGLDEYQFLPFLFGAAQLINNDTIFPKNSIDDDIIDKYNGDFMYLNCIKHIKSVKHGASFGEYSPLLYSLTDVKNWEKVAKGLVKMYEDEVLKKFVVVQHFFFGSVLTYDG